MDATISIMWEDMETWADEVTRSRPRGWSAAMGLGLGMSFASSPRSATSFQTLWTQPLPCAQLPFSFSVLDVKWLWKGQPGTQVSGGSDGETQSSSWAVVPAPGPRAGGHLTKTDFTRGFRKNGTWRLGVREPSLWERSVNYIPLGVSLVMFSSSENIC